MTRGLAMLVAFCALRSYGATADYGKIMQSTLKHSLGDDFRQYEWLSYPTNNFGVATMYVLESEKSRPSGSNQWCATFTCIGLSENQIPSDPRLRLTVNGFADVGSGGPISISGSDSASLAVGFFAPAIFNVLRLSAETSEIRLEHMTLRLGNISKRFLKKQQIFTFIDNLPASSPVRKALDSDRLAIVAGDVVIDSLELDLDLDEAQNHNLTARLDSLLNRKAGALTGMTVQVRREKKGQYRLIIDQPTVVARLTLRHPLRGRDVAPAARSALRPKGLSDWATWTSPDET